MPLKKVNSGDQESEVLTLPDFVTMLKAAGNEKRLRALDHLTNEGEESASELAEALSVAPNSLNYHVEELMAAGLVKNRKGRRDGGDRRYSYYIPTTRGKIVMGALREIYEELEAGEKQELLQYQVMAADQTGAREELEELRERIERLESNV